jgi:hypothetical protein
MEPEGFLPDSQDPSNCPYPESHQSSPYHPKPSLQDLFKYYPTTYVLVLLVVSFLLAFPFNLHVLHFSFPLFILHSLPIPSSWTWPF